MRQWFLLALWVGLIGFGGASAWAAWGQGIRDGQDAPPAPEIRQVGPHNALTIRAVGLPGHYVGFDVLADEQVVAPVRFTSHDLLFSSCAVAATTGLTATLTFDALQSAPDCGIALEHSRVIVTLVAQQYPVVAFDLHLTAFDARLWQATVGVQPFHFLTLAMPDATVWHQGGWLYPTPRADLFPLLLAPPDPALALNACTDNREWSRTPSLDAQSLPVIGLWSPARRVYAAWDFQEARLGANGTGDTQAAWAAQNHDTMRDGKRQENDRAANRPDAIAPNANTPNANALDSGAWERNIATGFCNRLVVTTDPFLMQTIETAPPSRLLSDPNTPTGKNGQPPPRRDPRTRRLLAIGEQASREYDTRGVSKFIALVTPPQPNPLADPQPAYPAPDAHLKARATLLFSTDLGGMDDPNRLCWERWWNTPAIQSRLARVPRVNDLGWLPDNLHLRALSSASTVRLMASTPHPAFLPGSLRLMPCDTDTESAVDALVRARDTTRLAKLQSDARLLITYAHRFTVDKEPCVYWTQPLAGEWTPEYGGEPASTFHHPDGWAAGRLLLDLYRAGREEEKKEKARQKEVVDGVFNWAKHVVWMRGGRADAPALPTVRDGAGCVAFLLDYYFTFKDDLKDGEHRSRALLALDMARSFAYRSLPMRAGGRGADTEPIRAFAWDAPTGAGGQEDDPGENMAAVNTLAQVAVHTGDPVLLWAVQGSMAGESLQRAMRPQERFSRSQGQVVPDGTLPHDLNSTGHSPFATGVQSLALPPPAICYSLLDPIGDSNARVLCGERAALCFNRGERDIVVTNYRCERAGEFAFTVRRLGAHGLRPLRGEAIHLTVTFAGIDLSQKTISVRHGNLTQRALRANEITRSPNALWTLLARDLRDGDTLVVGTPALNAAETLPSAPPLTE